MPSGAPKVQNILISPWQELVGGEDVRHKAVYKGRMQVDPVEYGCDEGQSHSSEHSRISQGKEKSTWNIVSAMS